MEKKSKASISQLVNTKRFKETEKFMVYRGIHLRSRFIFMVHRGIDLRSRSMCIKLDI